MTCEVSARGKPVYSTQGKDVRVNGGQSVTGWGSSAGGQSRWPPGSKPGWPEGGRTLSGGQGCALCPALRSCLPCRERRAGRLRMLRGPAHPVEAPWPPCPGGLVAALGFVPPEDSVSRRKRSAEGLKAPITCQPGTWHVWARRAKAPPASASCERGGGPFRGRGKPAESLSLLRHPLALQVQVGSELGKHIFPVPGGRR